MTTNSVNKTRALGNRSWTRLTMRNNLKKRSKIFQTFPQQCIAKIHSKRNLFCGDPGKLQNNIASITFCRCMVGLILKVSNRTQPLI